MSERLVILAPNWLGDAVMALPAIADVRRAHPGATIAVAARASIAPLFAMVPGIDAHLAIAADPSPLAGYDVAVLLPNAFRTALMACRAGVRQRWGYATDARRVLLTRAVDRPRDPLHQVAYYQRLVAALGCANGPSAPSIVVSDDIRQAGGRRLASAGWDGATPIVALAPGAAYGSAKRWPAEYFGELASTLAQDGVQSVVVGSAADRAAAAQVASAYAARAEERRARPPLLDMTGHTDLPALAGVLVHCRTLVTNDSGAMHVAAAAGVAVTAVFGPTRDRETRPVGERHVVLTHDVWCRPCMLRECPLDHRCMRGLDPSAVATSARRVL